MKYPPGKFGGLRHTVNRAEAYDEGKTWMFSAEKDRELLNNIGKAYYAP